MKDDYLILLVLGGAAGLIVWNNMTTTKGKEQCSCDNRSARRKAKLEKNREHVDLIAGQNF